MEIAQLFVSLGIKGSEKTVNALVSVNDGLGKIASTSLEVKAAILGALYALERLMTHSAQDGTALSNFSAYTEQSAQELQKWQYAAQQAGVAKDEFTSSLKSVYEKLSTQQAGKGPIAGIDLLAKTVGIDLQRAYKDTFYMMGQLNKFAKLTPEQAHMSYNLMNQVLKSAGLSDNVIAAMRKGVFNPKNFAAAPRYGENEIKQLDRVNVALLNLSQKMEMAFGHFFARHGQQFVADVEKVIVPVMKLLEAFTQLAEKLHIFELIGEAFKGWALILGEVVKLLDYVSGKNKDREIKKGTKNTTTKRDIFDPMADFFGSIFDKIKNEFNKSIFEGVPGFEKYPGNNNNITPKTPYLPPSSSHENHNNTFNMNMNFQHEGKDHQQLSDSVQRSINNAWKQLSAQSQAA